MPTRPREHPAIITLASAPRGPSNGSGIVSTGALVLKLRSHFQGYLSAGTVVRAINRNRSYDRMHPTQTVVYGNSVYCPSLYGVSPTKKNKFIKHAGLIKKKSRAKLLSGKTPCGDKKWSWEAPNKSEGERRLHDMHHNHAGWSRVFISVGA